MRALGDLYFESESQNDIELENPPEPGYYDTPYLSSSQLEELRSYVEGHPSYIGGVRDELGEELEELPSSGEEDDTPRPHIEPQARNIRKTSDGAILFPHPFYIGEIDRVSNNKNAIVSTATGEMVNLGRLPRSTIDEWTVGVKYRGPWSMCLTPQLWSEGYRSDAREYVSKLGRLTGLEGLSGILDIDNRKYDTDLHDTQIEVYVALAGHGLGVAYHGQWTIIIDSELVTRGQRVNVQTEEVYGNVVIATPCLKQSEKRLSPGDCVDLDISKTGKNLLIGVVEGELVTVPRETDVVPNELSVEITDVNEGFLTATVEALPPSERPAERECVDIHEGSIENFPHIPVQLPDTPLDESRRIRLPVSSVNTDSVSVSATVFEQLESFSKDEVISTTEQRWTSRGLLVFCNDVPLLVPDARYLPGVSARVRPTGFEDGFVEAELERYVPSDSPESASESLEAGNQCLVNREMEDAIACFAGAAEMTDGDEHPELWGDMLLHEILALTASHVEGENYSEALSVLTIRTESLLENESLPEPFLDVAGAELQVYKLLLEAKHRLVKAEQADDGIEMTTARKEVKEKLPEAVEQLNELQMQENSPTGRERPHWLIEGQLEAFKDNPLVLSQPVTEHLNSSASK